MRRRYEQLVTSHLQAAQALASGIHAVPDATRGFAATQAAHRFLNNERVSLKALAQPLIEAGCQAAAETCDRYLLVVHDWSQLMYPDHTSKRDRLELSSKHAPEGYELQTALLVSDRDGWPLAPAVLSLRSAEGVHCSRSWRVRPPLSPLDELAPTMHYLEQQPWGRRLVHVIDAEADSVAHFREWSQTPQRFFLVRADDRLVEHAGREQRCSALRDQQAFQLIRPVEYHGRRAEQWIAEVPVRLTRPGQRNRPGVGDFSTGRPHFQILADGI